MDATNKSKSKLIIGAIGGIVILLIIGGAVYALILSTVAKKNDVAQNTTVSKVQAVYSKEAVDRDLAELKAIMAKEKVQREKLQKIATEPLPHVGK